MTKCTEAHKSEALQDTAYLCQLRSTSQLKSALPASASAYPCFRGRSCSCGAPVNMPGASQGGLALAKEVYSPHLDMHQRLTILDALSTAARQLSSALPASASSPKKELSQPEAHSGSTKVGKSRRWAAKSLAKQQEGAPRTRRNRLGLSPLASDGLSMTGICVCIT